MRKKKRFSSRLVVVLILVIALSVVGCKKKNYEGEESLNIYNWNDYFAEDTISNFAERNEVTVSLDYFDSNEVLEAKLLSGNSGYDLVFPTASFAAKQLERGIYLELDKDQLDNFKRVNKSDLKLLKTFDPGNKHFAPYMTGTIGIGLDRDKVSAILGEDFPESWDLLFKPEYVQKLNKCGVSVMNSPAEVIPVALVYKGKKPNTYDDESLNEVAEILNAVAPHFTYISTDKIINDLGNGNTCMAMAYNGDVLQAQTRAEEAGKAHTVDYFIPGEGSLAWYDVMAIPAEASNVINAHKFINYIFEPEVIAAITNYVYYAHMIEDAMEFTDEEVKANPAVFVSNERKKDLYIDSPDSDETAKKKSKIWSNFLLSASKN